MEVVVAAIVAAAATTVVHDGCNGDGDGEEVVRRCCSRCREVTGVRVVTVERWLWRRDGEVDGVVVTPTVVAAAVGDDDGDVVWRWF
ncbi:hypothetical protein Tco_0608632 [Tanacetum coccineum]